MGFKACALNFLIKYKFLSGEIMKDSFQREIRYLRVSVTDRCNLRCRYCMPEEGVDKMRHQDILSLEDIYQIIEASSELGFNKIRITGGEPLVRKNIEWLIKKTSELEAIQEIALTTNGILLAEKAGILKNSGLDRVNVSIDSLKPDRFSQITRGGDLSHVLEGIKAAVYYDLTPIKINVVLIGGFNDDEIEDFAELTLNHDLHVRFIELMPIGLASSWAKEKFISNQKVIDVLKDLKPIEVEAGSPAEYYRIPGAKGKIGLINPVSRHFCNNCNRIRLTSDGKLKPCLHSDMEIDLKNALGNREEMIKIMQKAVFEKPSMHHINDTGYVPIKRNMNNIGG